MKRPLCGLLVTAAIIVSPSLVLAQTASSSSSSGSTADAAAAAQAAALAAARANAHNQSSFRSPRAPGAIGLPGLAASGGCMGSTSVGASFIGGGVGLGSSWQDQRCNAREDARLLAAFGYREQALQLLIQNSPMIAQVMAPPAAAGVAYRRTALEPVGGGYQPVSLNLDERYINGLKQVYRNGGGSPSPRCMATLALLQDQDRYLAGQVTGKTKPGARRNAALVQENLRTGIGNAKALCPSNVAAEVVGQVGARINQIDNFLATGRWVGPVG